MDLFDVVFVGSFVAFLAVLLLVFLVVLGFDAAEASEICPPNSESIELAQNMSEAAMTNVNANMSKREKNENRIIDSYELTTASTRCPRGPNELNGLLNFCSERNSQALIACILIRAYVPSDSEH